MTQKWKRPGDAQQRTTEARKDSQMGSASREETYGTCRELQIRHLRRRCGVRGGLARAVAALCFGEER